MHVSVCIVGFRNIPDITACLDALARSNHVDFDVVICENGGTAAFDALRAALPGELPGGQNVLVVSAPDNPGYAGGVNRCITARTDADAWWIVNPDARPEPATLPALLDRLSRGDVNAVGGTILLPDGRVQAHGGRWRAWLARNESMGRDTFADAPVDADIIERRMNYILGASLLADRHFLHVTGLMREDYFLYCEEVEWCLRAQARGLRLGFAPGARILHDQGSTTGSNAGVHSRPRLPIYLDERNKLNTVADTSPRLMPIAAIMSLFFAFMRFGRHRAWAQWGYALSGWAAGLRGERGKPRWLNPAPPPAP